ncbi:hypothetical protein BHE74_00042298 [Ensete ventricosum]|nr:hypothetical protein GW17_00056953 [Ensete ventricosum]RWW51363.1 hypothetical protein BHE74_00042298 [Ensete ventricosum]
MLLGLWVGLSSPELLCDRGWIWWCGKEVRLVHWGCLPGEHRLLSQLGDERNYGLHHPCQGLDLVSEIEECLTRDDRMSDAKSGSQGYSLLHEEGTRVAAGYKYPASQSRE